MGGKPGIQLFSVIYAILIGKRLDEFPRGWGWGARKKQAPSKCPPDMYVSALTPMLLFSAILNNVS